MAGWIQIIFLDFLAHFLQCQVSKNKIINPSAWQSVDTMANQVPPHGNNHQDEGSGGIAQVTFRVRCETLGHGESVFLSQAENPTGSRVSDFIVLSTSRRSGGVDLL